MYVYIYITAFNIFNIVSNFTKWIEFSLSFSLWSTGHRNPTLPRIPSTCFFHGNTFTFVAHNQLVCECRLVRYHASNDASLEERRPTTASRRRVNEKCCGGGREGRRGEGMARSLMNPLYREKCSSRFNFLATDDGENFSSISLIYLSLLLRKGTEASPSYILNNVPPLIQQQLAKIN